MLTNESHLPPFGTLSLHENPTGWGPVEIPKEYENMPYQPFAKDFRLGRVADWSGSLYQDMKSKGRYLSQFSGAQYAYIHDEDDTNFQLVSTGRDPKSSAMRPRYRFPMRGRRVGGPGGYNYQGTRGGYNQQGYPNRKMRNMSDRERMMQGQNRRWNPWNQQLGPGQRRPGGQQGWRNQNAWGGNQDRRQQHRAIRDSAIQIKDSWTLQEELDFTRLSKLALPNVKEPIDLVQCGEIEYYDKTYDRVNTRNERPLVRVNRISHAVCATEDPVIRRLAKQNVARVYCTDAVAASIMCCTRSVNPWEVVVIRTDDVLFFDERDKTEFDMISVCETAAEPPTEESGHINSARCLALEATFINTNLSQLMLLRGGKKYAFPEPNPFIDDDKDEDEEDSDEMGGSDEEARQAKRREKKDEELASIGYRYRLFDLGNQIGMVVRCEVTGALPPTNADGEQSGDAAAPPQFVYIRSLNEFDSRHCGGVDWRSKLDTQRGAVLASEIKNNAFKLAKWTACSMLAGADQLKLGFASRVNPKDSSTHVILGTQQFKPQEFAIQLNLNLDNAWGILRCVVDFFLKLPEGKYLLLKDPNKPMLRIFAVPSDTFDTTESERSDAESVANDAQKPALTRVQETDEVEHQEKQQTAESVVNKDE
ncbi:Eukaryotic translation initiation factor 3 subunit D [Clonorchis sinensis]|uniref:Eukaryotic translation initiation factor 3 subunit D n=2 Tax=Clonorchis sinensis TaxID=79923 RepID=A0A8T1N0Y3_CLOSI|nr:Eukaryotic translation initiation factor 3 subunit D [Clonorchis sinensis]